MSEKLLYITIFLFLSLGLFMLCGCVAPKGLQRTPWIGWEKKSFDRLGVELELPEQPWSIYKQYDMVISDNDIYIKNTGMKSISFGFHPSWTGSNFVEPIRCLNIIINRIPRDTYMKWGKSFCPKTVMEEHSNPPGSNHLIIGIKRQIKAPDGDVISVYGTYRKTVEGDATMDEDINAMRRIVESVRAY